MQLDRGVYPRGDGRASPTFLKVGGGWRIGYFNQYVALGSSDGYAKSGDKWYLRVYLCWGYIIFIDCQLLVIVGIPVMARGNRDLKLYYKCVAYVFVNSTNPYIAQYKLRRFWLLTTALGCRRPPGLVCGRIGSARLRRRTLVIRNSVGGWRMESFKLTVIRKLNIGQSYKCESEYKKVCIWILVL